MKVERGAAGEIAALVHEYEATLESIARAEHRGFERSYAAERLREIRSSLDTRFDEGATE